MAKIISALVRHRAARIAYWVALIFSIVLFTAGFIIPPMGEIHGSTLIAGGSVMIFTLIYIGLDIDDRNITISTHNPKTTDEYPNHTEDEDTL